MGLTHLRGGGEAKFFRFYISYVVFGNYFTIFSTFLQGKGQGGGGQGGGLGHR